MRAQCFGQAQRSVVALAALVLSAAPAQGDYLDDTGFSTLTSTPRLLRARGADIVVAQVEAGNGPFRPDQSNLEFSGKTLDGATGANASAHATMIGSLFYGNHAGLAPRVGTINVFDHDTFLTHGGLRVGTSLAPLDLGVSVINNSWIAAYADDARNTEAIRRLDQMIERDNVVVVNAMDNGAGSAFPKLLAPSFNGITVGVSSGNHSFGPISIDGGPLHKPDLVAPAANTSNAAAMVSGASALLQSEARARRMSLGALGTKALLMAGAERDSDWQPGAEEESDDVRNPLDPVYGAGSLRVDRSFRLLMGGEQNPGSVKTIGWDQAALPKRAKRGLIYRFKTGRSIDDFTAVLTWNREIKQSTSGSLDARLIDLDLKLLRKSGKKWKPVSRSASDGNNVEMIVDEDLPRGVYQLQVIGERTENYALAWSAELGNSGRGNSSKMSSLLSSDPVAARLMPMAGGNAGVGSATAAAVPEPSAGLLAAVGAGVLLRRRRR